MPYHANLESFPTVDNVESFLVVRCLSILPFVSITFMPLTLATLALNYGSDLPAFSKTWVNAQSRLRRSRGFRSHLDSSASSVADHIEKFRLANMISMINSSTWTQ